jgi:hypothetical protein
MVIRINPKTVRIVALLAMANMVSCYYNILYCEHSILRSYGKSKLAKVAVSAQDTHTYAHACMHAHMRAHAHTRVHIFHFLLHECKECVYITSYS